MGEVVNINEEHTVLDVEIQLISSVADVYIDAAKLREIDEGTIIAQLLEVIATNDGMLDALLDEEGGYNDPTD